MALPRGSLVAGLLPQKANWQASPVKPSAHSLQQQQMLQMRQNLRSATLSKGLVAIASPDGQRAVPAALRRQTHRARVHAEPRVAQAASILRDAVPNALPLGHRLVRAVAVVCATP